MSSKIPFPRPNFLKAQLKVGSVDLPSHVDNHYSNHNGLGAGNTEASTTNGASLSPCSLERSETMSSRILEIETKQNDDSEPTIHAFWLQRKLDRKSASRNVVARLGYKLRPTKNEKEVKSSCEWELDTDESGKPVLVRVQMIRTAVAEGSEWSAAMNEVCALHRIGQRHCNSPPMEAHVVGTNLVAEDYDRIYAILPYNRDGTLLEFCQSVGNLDEPLARFIFRQILEGLKTLKAAGMCHRNLSLDTVALDGDNVFIVGLGWAMRHDVTNNAKRIKLDGSTSMTNVDNLRSFPPIPGGSDPRFIAPESFYATNDTDDDNTIVWNGFRDDLWAAGLILYSMVVGTDALFAAPIAGDKHFSRLCIRGDVKGEIERHWERMGKASSSLPSADFVNLMQSMLSVDSNQRPTLEQVMEHPWVTNENTSAKLTNCVTTMPPIGM